jgi:hypothetical protein
MASGCPVSLALKTGSSVAAPTGQVFLQSERKKKSRGEILSGKEEEKLGKQVRQIKIGKN